MLSKLLKYEIRDTFKFFVPFYGVGLLLIAVASVWTKMNIDSPEILSNEYMALISITLGVAVVITFTAIFSAVSIFIITRFYKNMVGTEGYFMHSLPVSAHSLVISKLISSAILILVNVVYVIVAILIFVAVMDYTLIGVFFEDYFMEVIEFIFTTDFLPTILTSVASSILVIYLSICLGSNFKNKVIGGVVCYVLILIAQSFVVGFLSIIFGIEIFDDGYQTFSNVINVLTAAVSYFLSVHILTNKLNLE